MIPTFWKGKNNGDSEISAVARGWGKGEMIEHTGLLGSESSAPNYNGGYMSLCTCAY